MFFSKTCRGLTVKLRYWNLLLIPVLQQTFEQLALNLYQLVISSGLSDKAPKMSHTNRVSEKSGKFGKTYWIGIFHPLDSLADAPQILRKQIDKHQGVYRGHPEECLQRFGQSKAPGPTGFRHLGRRKWFNHWCWADFWAVSDFSTLFYISGGSAVSDFLADFCGTSEAFIQNWLTFTLSR